MDKTLKLSTTLFILCVILIVAIGVLWYAFDYQQRVNSPQGTTSVIVSSTEVVIPVPQITEASTASTTDQSATSSYSYGIANCLLLATSAGVPGYPMVSTTYNLYNSTSTGISFCYPSDVTIDTPLHFANPPSQIVWASGARMSIEFPQSVNRSASAMANLLANCLASGNTEEACITPQNYQIIHAINQNGLDYYIFWTDREDNVNGIVNTSTGPFAYVATPGNPTLFIPEPLGGIQYTPQMLRDLIVIFNTLRTSKSL